MRAGLPARDQGPGPYGRDPRRWGRGPDRAVDQGDRGRCSRPAGSRSSSAPARATTRSTSPRRPSAASSSSNCPGKNSIAVAELAFGLILALDRRIPDNVADLRAGRWNKKEYTQGARAVRPHAGPHRRRRHRPGDDRARARAFGMPVVAWSRRLTADRARRARALELRRSTRRSRSRRARDVAERPRRARRPRPATSSARRVRARCGPARSSSTPRAPRSSTRPR